MLRICSCESNVPFNYLTVEELYSKDLTEKDKLIVLSHTVFSKQQVNLVQLQICLGYFKFEPQNMLRVILCVSNAPFTYFRCPSYYFGFR